MKTTLRDFLSKLKIISSTYSPDRLYDGSMCFLPPKASAPEMGDVLKDKGLDSHQRQIALTVCNSHQSEVKVQKKLLEKHRLSQKGWSLDYQVLNIDKFYGSAEKKSGAENEYRICCSSSNPVIFLSVALELDYHLRSDYKLVANNDISGSSIDHWFNYLEKGGRVSNDLLNWALDASLLLYFHEVAHVIFGHCRYKYKNDGEARALELDADFNAGSMFGLLLDGFTTHGRKPSGVEEFSKRFLRANVLLGIVMKAISDQSERYHFPTTRTLIFNAGFAAALDHIGLTPKFESEDDGNKYWGKRTTSEKDRIYSALKKSSLSQYAGTELRLEEDFKDMQTKTSIIRDRLKNGPLEKLRLRT